MTNNSSSGIAKTKERNSSIELLRIISMLMILAYHFFSHGNFSFNIEKVSVERMWMLLVQSGGNMGVDAFVIISGYFLIGNTSSLFNFKRIFKFWGQIFFYSFGFFLIFVIFGNAEFSFSGLLEALFPVSFPTWWFASTYFVLYLLHPFINKWLTALDKATFQKLLILFCICWSIIPTFTTSSYQSNFLLWFIVLYSIGAYIKLYGLNERLNKKHYYSMWIGCMLLTYMSGLSFAIVGTKIEALAHHTLHFYTQQSIITLVGSVSMFMAFLKTDLGCKKWINVISSATFGVYLIHDNTYIRPLLWNNIFKNSYFQESVLIAIYSLLVTLMVYSVCTVIDLLRQQLIEKPVMKIIEKSAVKITAPFEKVIDKMKSRIF